MVKLPSTKTGRRRAGVLVAVAQAVHFVAAAGLTWLLSQRNLAWPPLLVAALMACVVVYLRRNKTGTRALVVGIFAGVAAYMLSSAPLTLRTAPTLPTAGTFTSRLVHLDMKGAPPKVRYLQQLFPLLKKWGATGLLIEWEDMFPYSGVLAPVASPHAYTPQEIETILTAAKQQDFVVIPLVQTFGHLEFVLKHFPELRESVHATSAATETICPSHERTLPLLRMLLDQVISAHRPFGITTIHLGADEVHDLGTCTRCATQMEQMPSSASAQDAKAELFLAHMERVLQHVQANARLTALMWDDMLRQWPLARLLRLAPLVQPVVWEYTAFTPEEGKSPFPVGMWDRYNAAWPANKWAATAFKGAIHASNDFVQAEHHVANHLAWIRLAKDLELRFDGAILTGWSRYYHRAPLCELLAAGIPSLALNLAILQEGVYNDELRQRVNQELGLGDLPMEYSKLMKRVRSKAPILSLQGTFPGAEFYAMLGRMEWARATLTRRRDQSPAVVEAAAETVRSLKLDMRLALSHIVLEPAVIEFLSKLDT